MSFSLDQELPARQMRALEEHLSACPACREEWIVLERVSAWLSAAPLVGPRPGFTARVMTRLAERQARPRLIGAAVFLLLGSVLVPVLVALLAIPSLVELWQAASSPALTAGLEIALSQCLTVLRSFGQAMWVIMGALAAIWSHPLFMSYVLLVLLLTVVWVRLVKLQRPTNIVIRD